MDPLTDGLTDAIGIEFYYTGEVGILQVHGPAKCSDRPEACCIHRPSDHPLKGATQVWDGLSYIMYRRCPHNQLHPDKDHLGYVVRLERQGGHTVSISGPVESPFMHEQTRHECDGCCLPPVHEPALD